MQVNTSNVWLKHVPLKISLFAWSLFHNRLPTKDNLIMSVIIQAEASTFLGGCGIQESADHLFITCRHFIQLWTQICSWLGISSIDSFCAHDHFHQFSQLGGFPRQTHSFLKLIWFTCIWTIWKERNNRIFSNQFLELHQLLD
jgi:hypothetical protein